MADHEVAQTAEELATNLDSYERQLAEVEELLLEDPDNSELVAIFDNLTEVLANLHLGQPWMEEARPNITCNEPLFHLQVIQLAKELCRADTAAAAQQPQPSKHEGGQLVPALDARGTASPAPVPTAAPGTFSSLLPPQVAEQIRLAQQRAALSGQGLPAWAVGAKCRAVYSGDGNWWVAVALREGDVWQRFVCVHTTLRGTAVA